MASVNICRLSGTSFSRSFTYVGTFSNIGTVGQECDGDASTYYGGQSTGSGTADVGYSETITFSQAYDITSVYLKIGLGSNGTRSGYCKLYDSSGTLIATVWSGSVSVDSTYSTGWSGVKRIDVYGYAQAGPFTTQASVLFYEIQAWANVSTCALSGTATPSCNDVNIQGGGRTLVYTVSDCTWVASISTIATALISGMSGTGDWGTVKSALSSSNFTRNSDTVVTLTLPAVAGYSISANETVTCNVPSSATSAGTELAGGSFSVVYSGLSYIAGAIVHVNDVSDHGGYVSTVGITSPTVSMGGGYACVQGAMHVCPISGHGTTSITAKATKSYIGGKLILTTECVAGCGAKIYPPDRTVYVEP